MLKAILISTALVAGTSTFALDASARTKHHRVLANGRCSGVSYGTGARSCGTKTGGPVGGNANKN